MAFIDTATTVYPLIVGAGGGAVATYFWQRFTRRLDANTLEARSALIKQFRESEVSDKAVLETNQDRLEAAYANAMYIESINQLVRQIHKASRSWAVHLKVIFGWLLGFLILLGLSYWHSKIGNSLGRVVLTVVVVSLIFFFMLKTVDYITKHHESTKALKNALLSVKTSEQTHLIIRQALEGETFIVKKKKAGDFYKTYHPKPLVLSSNTSYRPERAGK